MLTEIALATVLERFVNTVEEFKIDGGLSLEITVGTTHIRYYEELCSGRALRNICWNNRQ